MLHLQHTIGYPYIKIVLGGMMMKNIAVEKVVSLKDEVSYLQDQVVSKTLTQNEYMSLTLFAFDKGEEISTHKSRGDALLLVLEGTAFVTLSDKEYVLEEGQSLLMPATFAHAVNAREQMKMLLIVDFYKKVEEI